MIARNVALVAAFMLAGCAAPSFENLDKNAAVIAPGLVFQVASLQAPAKDANVAQQIVAHFRDQTYAFDVQIQISPQELDLAALDGMGRRALTVNGPGATR